MDFAERLSIAEQQYRHAEWKLHFTERLDHGAFRERELARARADFERARGLVAHLKAQESGGVE
jgi:hypothetical protein